MLWVIYLSNEEKRAIIMTFVINVLLILVVMIHKDMI